MRQMLIGEVVEVIEKMERETGFEPATSSLPSWTSAIRIRHTLPVAALSRQTHIVPTIRIPSDSLSAREVADRPA